MQHEKKAVFWVVANPISGRKEKKPFLDKLIASLKNKGFSVKLHWTEYQGHGKLLAEQAKQAEVELVIVVGGDGSFNEVAAQLVGCETAVTVCPFGSGNGWYQNFSRRFRYDPWLEKITARSYQKIDVGSLNGHYFFNVASLGFVASVANEFQKLTKRGFFSYVKRIFFCFRLLELKSYQGGQNLFQIPKAGFFQFLKPDNKKPWELIQAESIESFVRKETARQSAERRQTTQTSRKDQGVRGKDATFSGQPSFEQALEKGLEHEAKNTKAEELEQPTIYPRDPEYKAITFYAHNIDFFLGKTYGGFLTVNRDKTLTSGSLRVMISHLRGDFFRPPPAPSRKNSLKQAALVSLAAIFLGLRYGFGILRNNLFIIEEDVAEAEFLVASGPITKDINEETAPKSKSGVAELRDLGHQSKVGKKTAQENNVESYVGLTKSAEQSQKVSVPWETSDAKTNEAVIDKQGKTLIQVDGEERWVSGPKLLLKVLPQVLKVPN